MRGSIKHPTCRNDSFFRPEGNTLDLTADAVDELHWCSFEKKGFRGEKLANIILGIFEVTY